MLSYSLTFIVFDHENIVFTLKKCQFWQKFNVGEITLLGGMFRLLCLFEYSYLCFRKKFAIAINIA